MVSNRRVLNPGIEPPPDPGLHSVAIEEPSPRPRNSASNTTTSAGRLSRRRLLLISFYYPPDNSSSGTLRPTKFTKYLSDFGWDCSVLAPPVRHYPSTDPSLLNEIPASVSVHRTFCIDTKTAFSICGRYPGLLAVPDRYISWLPFALRKGVHVARREKVDAILSTSPIPTTHLIALMLKRLIKCPWVADFRDPWVETEGSERHHRLRESVELWMERRVVHDADRITVTTEEFREWLCARYGNTIKPKTHAVYNGYDETDFEGLQPGLLEADNFTLLHAGLIDAGYRDPAPLLEAVRLCLDRGAVPPDLRVRILGGGAYAESQSLARTIADLGLQSVVEMVGRLPYRRTLAALMQASVLLLMQGREARMLIPAKAFEYLRAGRPILALAPAESATARLVRSFEGCFVADPDDASQIARQLTSLAGAWKLGLRSVNHSPRDLAQYSRAAAAGALARILDSTCDPDAGSRLHVDA